MVDFLIFKGKEGWRYGPHAPNPDSRWLVDVPSFCWGLAYFTNNNNRSLLAARFVPISDPKPISLKLFAEGEEFPLWVIRLRELSRHRETEFRTTSISGTEAACNLIDAIRARAEANEECFYPVVKLETDSYRHPRYGEVRVPRFKIVDWKSPDNGRTARM
jgi:hypothetical protein